MSELELPGAFAFRVSLTLTGIAVFFMLSSILLAYLSTGVRGEKRPIVPAFSLFLGSLFPFFAGLAGLIISEYADAGAMRLLDSISLWVALASLVTGLLYARSPERWP